MCVCVRVCVRVCVIIICIWIYISIIISMIYIYTYIHIYIYKVETIRNGPSFDGHSDTFIYRMLPLSGSDVCWCILTYAHVRPFRHLYVALAAWMWYTYSYKYTYNTFTYVLHICMYVHINMDECWRMLLALVGAGDGGAVEGDTNKNDGCNAGYVKNKAVNLCVPATSTPWYSLIEPE